MKRLLLVCVSALAAVQLHASPVSGRVSFVTKRGQNPVVAETVVWLEPAAGTRVGKRSPVTAQMTTRGKTLLPHILVIPVGSTVKFPNEDPISHNLFSLSAANQFDLGLYRTGAGKAHTFDQPGVVNVYCNVHPNMSAVVHVLATPYYTFADGNGNFSFADAPAGKYDVVAWNEQSGTARVPVDLSAAGVSGLALVLDSRAYRAGAHTNKLGKPYEAPRSRDY